MSLIYSALNKLEPESGPPGAPDPVVMRPYAVVARKPGTPRWVYLVIAGCVGVVLAGWLSMNALRAKFAAVQGAGPVSQSEPQRPDAPPPVAAVEVVPAVVPVAPPGVTAAVDLSVAGVPVPMMTPVQALPSSPGAPVVAASVQATTGPAKAAPAKPKARARSPEPMITEAAPPEPLDPQVTAQLTQAVRLAIQAGKNVEAQGLLRQLATRLPPESITLLRLNAWHRMQSGDAAQAMVLYRQITERLPGDESAGINLALLNWKAGQQDEARRLIGALAERHPESDTVQKYSRELGASR